MIATTDILPYIPQRPPFVMVSELLHADSEVYRTSFEIKEDNIMVKDGALTAGGLVENMAQTAAAGTGYHMQQQGKKTPVGYIGALKNLKVDALPQVGDVIISEIVTVHQIFNAHVAKGKVMRGDEVIATCEFKIFTKPEDE